jgi:oligopeptide transport system permease protein
MLKARKLRWQFVWMTALIVLSPLGLLRNDICCEQHLDLRNAHPCVAHCLGTDFLGRDMLWRLLCGGCVSISVGITATAIALIIGTSVGMISGYVGGVADRLIMGTVNAIGALPLILLTLLFLIFIGNSMFVLCLAIAFTEWLTLARVIRSSTQDLRQRTFVQCATALGQSHSKILISHIFPHLIPILSDYALLLMSNAILLEAFLSFLGIGVQPPRSSWGNMIVDGARTLNAHPWQLLLPSACLFFTLLSLTTLRSGGDSAMQVDKNNDELQ